MTQSRRDRRENQLAGLKACTTGILAARASAASLRAGANFISSGVTASGLPAISAGARSSVGVDRIASACDRSTADVARAQFSCNELLFDVAGPSLDLSWASVRANHASFCVAGPSVTRCRSIFRVAQPSFHADCPSVRVERAPALATFVVASIDPGSGRPAACAFRETAGQKMHAESRAPTAEPRAPSGEPRVRARPSRRT